MPKPLRIPSDLEEKIKVVEGMLSPYPSLAVAFSGGVDSTLLAWLLLRMQGKKVLGLWVETPFAATKECRGSRTTAAEIGLQLEVISFDPTAVASVRENSLLRCYFCKKELMSRIKSRARALGYPVVVEGSHASDAASYRPGRKALSEMEILSPLAAAGFHKDDIREMSRLAGLPTWSLPSQSCLATRIPYGTPLSIDLLRRVEAAEAFLWDLGCRQVRVRCHGDLARIEIPPPDFPLILKDEVRGELLSHFQGLGFLHISLDLEGYRSGCWDKMNG
ncbi:ATP-dependent sacrificial sulfur transferase LarE [Desulforhabdus sp. TSK]|uniref:ATP-dependent sacrificial sulfur transferase LarE n=1 Tax=Desulforhabdus sp. TSK TaxID=2925014 RepID=UPI001FC843C5|nr:ATP-dependent sacrificial sulfur transferase LarE [Desulforhabdus sp. TSK]GKT07725.1 7-cyano-7-deazaguanine synthase [Desulforhabdus sp. TSK]